MTENREDYNPPVADLLTLGDISQVAADYDYLAHGFTTAHIPELQRMALDEELHWEESEGPLVWAPIHAWRTLGQLGDPAGVETLIQVLLRMEDWDDDWTIVEAPKALGFFGAPAIVPLQELLADRKVDLFARVAAAEALGKIVDHYPAEREAVLNVLTAQLGDFAEEDPEFNAFLISTLVDLKAVEAAAVMAQAFAADKVDWSIQGDWEEVQIALGLLTERITPKPARWNDLGQLFSPRQSKKAKDNNPAAAAKRKKERNVKKLAKQTKQKQRAQKKKKRK